MEVSQLNSETTSPLATFRPQQQHNMLPRWQLNCFWGLNLVDILNFNSLNNVGSACSLLFVIRYFNWVSNEVRCSVLVNLSHYKIYTGFVNVTNRMQIHILLLYDSSTFYYVYWEKFTLLIFFFFLNKCGLGNHPFFIWQRVLKP